jgi:cysteine desulfurase
MRVYFDNAATTPLAPEVMQEMFSVMQERFGNPSSVHVYGREARALIEQSRKTIANLFNVSPGEIIFTSGATEANNMVIRCSVRELGIRHIISSPVEHHAVEHTLRSMHHQGEVDVHWLQVDRHGYIDLNELEHLLSKLSSVLVSVMHANNEIGTIYPIEAIGNLCRKYNALFHSDTVQTIAHYPLDLKNLPVDFVTCSAHKFHGPKGIGFLYIRNGLLTRPMITGGSQERNMRGGTENIYGIAGMTRALHLAYQHLERDRGQITALRKYMINRLLEEFPDVEFNTDIHNESLYTVLNVSFPACDFAEMFLFTLDINGIAASGGSACSSGSNTGSHVLNAIGADARRPAVRFSFSRYNTPDEVDYVMEKLREMYAVRA